MRLGYLPNALEQKQRVSVWENTVRCWDGLIKRVPVDGHEFLK